ncbi:hypothetical protein HOLleu_22430 [Holothuria leucospilota]|uniref:Uncharacterized protein n=1 Tax=Holothuria leucospilota TaxID=206669 RepID=A0A9Q1H6S0_HOLLE|nr:hypothetical protein HOLleu_22430 [Holothuria leucospilota]
MGIPPPLSPIGRLICVVTKEGSPLLYTKRRAHNKVQFKRLHSVGKYIQPVGIWDLHTPKYITLATGLVGSMVSDNDPRCEALFQIFWDMLKITS